MKHRRPRDLRVTPRGELAPPPGRDALVSVGVTASGGPVAIWSSSRGGEVLTGRDAEPGRPSFPHTRPAEEHAVTLVAYTAAGEVADVVAVSSLPVAHPHVDRFPDGSFLVVGARARWTSAGGERNALVVGPDGRVVRRGCLGDGLQHVQVAADGTIWTGYFDEGIFGNFGWGGADGPAPLGAGGIVAWSPALEFTWGLDPEDGLVADCYSLVVTQDAVLACTYTDFPVLRIADGVLTEHVTQGIAGPRGIVASGDRVGLLGGYDDPWLLVVGRLGGGRFAERSRRRLRSPSGTRLPPVQVHCRGSELHAFVGSTWFSVDLAAVED
ncbi:hypothetical protein [Cellulomonas cellasea]|uniref:Uncharacterized protein n=1 Tax=Cellulomonas cellasea TaxID=43670 RepID=A0A7W4YDA3_9CELL|nr:hypothetical protein [Cellulomonas cellasea]MBB2924502.1 hypothetical protein [Cellulomonas cellasea]